MLKKDEILKWLDVYAIDKYPASVYNELVVEQRPYPGRLKILGAWKTGCLRVDMRGSDYIDRKGAAFSFTGRWNPKSPVGYSTWLAISDKERNKKGNTRGFFYSKTHDNYPIGSTG